MIFKDKITRSNGTDVIEYIRVDKGMENIKQVYEQDKDILPTKENVFRLYERLCRAVEVALGIEKKKVIQKIEGKLVFKKSEINKDE